jgi:hypothetical protein
MSALVPKADSCTATIDCQRLLQVVAKSSLDFRHPAAELPGGIYFAVAVFLTEDTRNPKRNRRGKNPCETNDRYRCLCFGNLVRNFIQPSLW